MPSRAHHFWSFQDILLGDLGTQGTSSDSVDKRKLGTCMSFFFGGGGGTKFMVGRGFLPFWSRLMCIISLHFLCWCNAFFFLLSLTYSSVFFEVGKKNMCCAGV